MFASMSSRRSEIWDVFLLQRIQRHSQLIQVNSSPPTSFYSSIENSNSKLDQPKPSQKGIFNFECSMVMWYFSMFWKIDFNLISLGQLYFFPTPSASFFGAWLVDDMLCSRGFNQNRRKSHQVRWLLGGDSIRFFETSRQNLQKLKSIFPWSFFGCFLVNLLRIGSIVNGDFCNSIIIPSIWSYSWIFFEKEHQNNQNLFPFLHLYWIQLAIYRRQGGGYSSGGGGGYNRSGYSGGGGGGGYGGSRGGGYSGGMSIQERTEMKRSREAWSFYRETTDKNDTDVLPRDGAVREDSCLFLYIYMV